MSERPENEADIREAAAVGAAAAVDAIVEEQHEDERASAVEQSAQLATGAAVEAAEESQQAAEAATAAATAASEALDEADTASAEAQQASAEATEAKSELAELRDHIASGFRELREFMVSRDKPASEEPTEVVVSHASESRENTGERDNAGSGGSPTPDDRPYRHRFGRRIT